MQYLVSLPLKQIGEYSNNHIGARRVTDMDPLPSGIAGYAMYVHIHTYTCTHKYAMFNAEIDHMAAVVVT